ncbi:MAG: phosphotriesterase family protein [Streptosporangiaceae bacterium]
MAQVETVKGPIDADRLGITLMHEHVFVLNEEIRRNFPGDWDEQERIEDAATKLTALARRGCVTIADPTVLGLGRDIARVQQVAARTDLNIIAATGLYTYNDVPLYFRYRGLGQEGTADDPMTQMFIDDITTGITGTGVKAAFLKCAIEAEGRTPGVERVLRCVAYAHLATGAPITVHTHPGSRSGLTVAELFREVGVDLTKVVLGHSGDTTDLDYLTELADTGCLLGMDRFGLNLEISFEERADTVAAMCARGYAPSMVLSQDASCFIDWFGMEQIPLFAPKWNFEHLFDEVFPALADRGVTPSQLDTMLVANPRRYFTAT